MRNRLIALTFCILLTACSTAGSQNAIDTIIDAGLTCDNPRTWEVGDSVVPDVFDVAMTCDTGEYGIKVFSGGDLDQLHAYFTKLGEGLGGMLGSHLCSPSGYLLQAENDMAEEAFAAYCDALE